MIELGVRHPPKPRRQMGIERNPEVQMSRGVGGYILQRRMRRRLFIIWYPVAVGLEAEGVMGGGRGR